MFSLQNGKRSHEKVNPWTRFTIKEIKGAFKDISTRIFHFLPVWNELDFDKTVKTSETHSNFFILVEFFYSQNL